MASGGRLHSVEEPDPASGWHSPSAWLPTSFPSGFSTSRPLLACPQVLISVGALLRNRRFRNTSITSTITPIASSSFWPSFFSYGLSSDGRCGNSGRGVCMYWPTCPCIPMPSFRLRYSGLFPAGNSMGGNGRHRRSLFLMLCCCFCSMCGISDTSTGLIDKRRPARAFSLSHLRRKIDIRQDFR